MSNLLIRSKFLEDLSALTRLSELRSWVVISSNYPVIDILFDSDKEDVQKLRLKIECDSWDAEPVSIELQHSNGMLMTCDELRRKMGVINGSAHTTTGRPFICRPGVKEFHEHDSHKKKPGDSWKNFRGKEGHNLLDIITDVWSQWRCLWEV